MGELREYRITCPWCWEEYSSMLETEAEAMELVEDCQVCCHPIQIQLLTEPDGSQQLRLDRAV